MNKILTLFVSFFGAITLFAQKQEVPETILVNIGEFKAQDKMYEAQAYISKDTSLVYLYCIQAVFVRPLNYYSEYKPKIYIGCTTTMKDELLLISEKYKEWVETAKSNDVGKFSKVIELEFPIMQYSLHKNAKGYPKYFEWNNRKFTFNLYDIQKTPSIFCSESFEGPLGIKISVGLVFNTPEEFESFVDFLDPEKVKQRIREGKTTLFTQVDHLNSQQDVMPKPAQQKEGKGNVGYKKVDKGKIANEALTRWKNAAKKVSVVK